MAGKVSRQDNLLTELRDIERRIRSLENRQIATNIIIPGDDWINVKEHHGAEGDGVTDDYEAIQAAVDAVAEAGGGTVYFPSGEYICNSTITTPLGVTVIIQGSGLPIIGLGHGGGTEIKAETGTDPILTSIGTSNDNIDRGHVSLRDIGFHGNGQDRIGVQYQRCGEFDFNRVRFVQCGITALELTQCWNVNISKLFVGYSGDGTNSPAMLCDSITGAGTSGGSDTVLFTDCQFEANNGIDIQLTGSTGDSSPSTSLFFENVKMEGGSGSYPYILMDYCQCIKFTNLQIGTSRTGSLIEHSTPFTRTNQFTNLYLESSGSPTYYVDQTDGVVDFANIAVNGTPATAIFHIGSSVGAGNFRIKGMQGGGLLRFDDDRTVDEELGKGRVQILPAFLTGVSTIASTSGLGFRCPNAGTSTFQSMVHPPSDIAGNNPVTIRLIWTGGSNTGNHRLRVQSANGQNPTGGSTTGAVTSYTTTVADTTSAGVTKVTNIEIGNMSAQQYIYLAIQRLGDDGADTATANFDLFSAELVYEKLI